MSTNTRWMARRTASRRKQAALVLTGGAIALDSRSAWSGPAARPLAGGGPGRRHGLQRPVQGAG
jgi:hypothetical protein